MLHNRCDPFIDSCCLIWRELKDKSRNFPISQPFDSRRINEKTNFHIAQFSMLFVNENFPSQAEKNRRLMSKEGKTIHNFMVVAANSQGWIYRNKENNYASCLTDCELYGKTIKRTRQRRKKKRQSSSNKHPETNKENVCCV